MTVIAKTIQSKTLVIIDLICGSLIILAAFIFIPIAIFSIDASLISNPSVWGIVIVLMLFFGMTGFFAFIRPVLIYRKLPAVQAETDGTYLYIYGRKEAKIPLVEMEEASIDTETPNMMTRDFFIHLISEEYGRVNIKVKGYGRFKLYFVSGAKEVHYKILEIVENKIKEAKQG